MILDIWSRDRCPTLTVLQHSYSASNPADGDAFWTLGHLAVTTELVDTATKTSCRDWAMQSMPCSKTSLASEELIWQLCHHQTARSDCRRARQRHTRISKDLAQWKPHDSQELPRSATVVQSMSASVCLVLLSGRKQFTAL